MRINPKRLEVLFEFLMFGIVIGIIEDLIAVKLATGESITKETLLIVVAVAIPFAIIGEIIADNIDFIRLFTKIRKRFLNR
ncbi:MAG: hypothetical protein Q8Q18_02130 [bacterium]|nr:hypothetical protein [bacterium]